MMHDAQQSDAAILAMKAANKGKQFPAESLERRAATERNPQRTGTVRTQSRGAVSPGAERIRQFVKEKPITSRPSSTEGASANELSTSLTVTAAPSGNVTSRAKRTSGRGARRTTRWTLAYA